VHAKLTKLRGKGFMLDLFGAETYSVHMKKIIIAIMAALVLASCASWRPEPVKEEMVMGLIDSIIQDETAWHRSVHNPMLLNEVLISSGRIEFFQELKNKDIFEAGYSIESIEPIYAFEGNFEVQAFYSRYVTEDARMVKLQFQKLSCSMILQKIEGDLKILGFFLGGDA
jgi:hypothetical protein